MEDLARLIGHKYVTDFVILDSPKDLEKAAEKMFDEDRNMHDLNRGRVLFTSYEQYELFIRRFVQKKGSKKFHETWQDKITVIEGKQDDYLKNAGKAVMPAHIISMFRLLAGKIRNVPNLKYK